VAAGIDMPLPGAMVPPGAVTLGVRPEHLAPAPPETPGAITLAVRAVETLGADAYVHGHVTGTADEIVVRLPGSAPPPGDRLAVAIAPGFVHLFDAETGRRLGA
jgi:sn-glycerol 3-phosphate transport system ATP-binding protein